MKPTRSETRGTWMLAALCAAAVACAVLVSRCDDAAPEPDALPFQAEAHPADTAAVEVADTVAGGRKSVAEKARRRGRAARSAPRRQVPDNPSPLDRPVR